MGEWDGGGQGQKDQGEGDEAPAVVADGVEFEVGGAEGGVGGGAEPWGVRQCGWWCGFGQWGKDGEGKGGRGRKRETYSLRPSRGRIRGTARAGRTRRRCRRCRRGRSVGVR